MPPKEKTLSTWSIWQLTWLLLVGLKRQFLVICFGLVFIPGLFLSIYFAHASLPVSASLKAFSDLALSSGQAKPYQDYFGVASPFLTLYVVCILAYLLVVVGAYFALVRLAIARSNGEQAPPVADALRQALRDAFPRGLLLLMMFFIFSLEQLLFGPFHVFTLFLLMAPILMVTENRGVWSATRQALFFRYASPARGGGLSVAFILISLSALLYALEVFLEVFGSFLLRADEWLGLPRALWAAKIPGLPFGPVYAVTQIMSMACYALTMAFVVGFLVSLFLYVRPQVSQRI